MKNYKFPLASSSWDEKEYRAIQDVVDSKMFTMGNKVQEFERNFSKYLDSKYSVMVNSGSSANLLMIAALFYTANNSLQQGDEVIVPAISWSTTYSPLHQYGLKLKFVDIDIETLNFDLEKLSEAISEKTKVILCVNLLGNPNDFEKINDLVKDKEIIILEDNCESLGAEFNEKKAGTYGLMGTFSSFFSHHISTMEGGIVTTDDEELYHILLSLRAHGWTRNLPKINHVTGTKSENDFEESFNFVLPGYNLRPLEMSGAIGIEQIKKLEKLIEFRRKNANDFISLMQDSENLMIQKEIGESSWFGFSLVIKKESKLTRKKLIEILEMIGIESRPIVTGNFLKNKVIKYYDYSTHGDMVNAEYVDKNGLFIGNHHYSISEAFKKLKEAGL